ncbi:uncharacterized protein LOC124999928 [Mugil cephalus]|uniref:uncharacterized protein LOC124999928 n=1 Tax=Mugil cephalus TaxID=48193 RepID=UPI001FB5C4D4|nr:uncharacterized protein LOC124999928 [Mugil cephalus]
MCYNATGYILIEDEPKDWCQAQYYCRRHYTDLVSISDDKQNAQVTEKGNAKTFWIGLMHDQWEWIDKSCSTYRTWSSDRETSNDIILHRYTRGLLETDNSGFSYQVICAQGSVRIKVINRTLTWERALEYCKKHHTGLLQIDSEEDQAAVEHWLKHDNTVSAGPLWIGMRSPFFGFWICKETYNNWKNGNQPELPFINNCGAININDYTWTDEDCGRELPFICEEEISFLKN